MSDRYKNEIEKILEDTPDLPDAPPEPIGSEESFYSQMLSTERNTMEIKVIP